MSSKTNYANIMSSIVSPVSKNNNPKSKSTLPYSSYDSRSTRETSNYSGGYSFDECKAVKQAIQNGENDQAYKISKSYLTKIATIGTNKNMVVCTSKELSTAVINFVNYLLGNNLADLIIQVVSDVYTNSRAKSVDHSMFLLALCTTAQDSVSGSPSKTAVIRNIGYSFVKNLRTGSHFLQWVSTHIGICKKYGSKGTGNGFRNACKSWFLKHSPKNLQYQIIKYGNRTGVTMKDVLSLSHIKPTSKKHNNKHNNKHNSTTIKDYMTPSMQFIFAYVVNGLDYSLKELNEIINRKLTSSETGIKIGEEMTEVLERVAYAIAVELCKSESTNIDMVIDIINVFGLTHEMINNTFMKDPLVLAALASRENHDLSYCLKLKEIILSPHIEKFENIKPFFDAFKNNIIYRNDSIDNIVENNDLTSLLEYELANAISDHINDYKSNLEEKNNKTIVTKPRKFTMPYAATLRFLNRFTISGIFDRAAYPLSPQMRKMLSEFLINPYVISRSHIHPFSIMTSLSTYKAGRGFKGSMTWNPAQFIVDSLETAMKLSFNNCKPHGKIVAHLIDGSGSMRTDNSTSIPFCNASEVCAFMVGLSMQIENVDKNLERFYAGVFQGWTRGAHTYVDITDQLTTGLACSTSLETCQNILSRIDGGMTNMQIGFDYYRVMLENSLQLALSGDRRYKHIISALQLPGFIELFQMWTDNEINSGKKIPECLDEYHIVQRKAIHAFPYNLNGESINPDLMFTQHCAKLTIVCTQASNYVVGDPFDTRILCISGFDSSGPQLITNFLEDWDNKTNVNVTNNIVPDIDDFTSDTVVEKQTKSGNGWYEQRNKYLN
jgi:hypothetical protein